MTADEFWVQLEGCAPSIDALIAQGLSVSEAEAFRAGYRCRRIAHEDQGNPLLDFCRNFAVCSVEVSAFTFCQAADFGNDRILIGYCEADPVVFSLKTGRVSACDHEDPTRELCLCARTAEGFLGAILVVARSATQRALGGEPSCEDQDLAQCLALAGEECRPFCGVLLGVD